MSGGKRTRQHLSRFRRPFVHPVVIRQLCSRQLPNQTAGAGGDLNKSARGEISEKVSDEADVWQEAAL
jgi:hypothetical protein